MVAAVSPNPSPLSGSLFLGPSNLSEAEMGWQPKLYESPKPRRHTQRKAALWICGTMTEDRAITMREDPASHSIFTGDFPECCAKELQRQIKATGVQQRVYPQMADLWVSEGRHFGLKS